MDRSRGRKSSAKNAADDIVATMVTVFRRMMDDRPASRGGNIVPGSWNPAEGTVSVQYGDEGALDDDRMFTEPQVYTDVPLVGQNVNDQEGPRGGEPGVMFTHAGGWMFAIDQRPVKGQPVTTAGAPPGERWIAKRTAAGALTGLLKFTNDAKTAGDSKGGVSWLVGALLSIFTGGGISLSFDDSVPNVTLVVGAVSLVLDDSVPSLTLTAGALVVKMDGSAGTIQVGDTSLGTPDEVVTKTDLQSAITAMEATYNAHTHAGVASGGAVTAPPAQQMDVTATGSSVVESQE